MAGEAAGPSLPGYRDAVQSLEMQFRASSSFPRRPGVLWGLVFSQLSFLSATVLHWALFLFFIFKALPARDGPGPGQEPLTAAPSGSACTRDRGWGRQA